MSYRHVQIRTILSSLMAVTLLLADVPARSNDTALAVPDAQHQCGSLSPSFTFLGDAYFDLDTASESAVLSTETVKASELLSRLGQSRFQDGWGQRVLCIGSPDQIRKRVNPVMLEEITVRGLSQNMRENAILITAFEYDKQQRRLRRESVTIPTRNENVLHLSTNRLLSSMRHRQATPIGSYLEETRTEAFLNENTITIEQSIFVNGTLAQWHTWHLPG